MTRAVRHETILAAQSSSSPNNTTTYTVRKTMQSIDSLPLAEFDEITFEAQITTALIGSVPTIDLYLQRALRPNPDPTIDAHWEDIANLATATTGLLDDITTLPVVATLIAAGATMAGGHARSDRALAARTQVTGPIGDVLRIVEKISSTGAITTAAVYSVHATGIRH